MKIIKVSITLLNTTHKILSTYRKEKQKRVADEVKTKLGEFIKGRSTGTGQYATKTDPQ